MLAHKVKTWLSINGCVTWGGANSRQSSKRVRLFLTSLGTQDLGMFIENIGRFNKKMIIRQYGSPDLSRKCHTAQR